jgi:hypothetical protein
MHFPHPEELKVKRRRIFFALGVLVALVGLVAFLCRPDEPSYEGRTLGAWLQDFANPFGDVQRIRDFRSFDFRGPHERAEKAVLAIGTNAFPTLLKYIRTRDSAPKRAFASLAQSTPILRSRFWTEQQKTSAAHFGFIILRDNAQPVVPALFELTKNKDPKIRLRACACLTPILKAEVKPLVPVLVPFRHDSDLENRREAADQLRLIGMFLTDDEAEKAGLFEAFPEFRPNKTKSTEAKNPPN